MAHDLEWLATTLPVWGTDQLPTRVPQLRALLEHSTVPPTVIYLHCDCGCDRTGEVMGSYAMQYLGKSWSDTCKWNNAIAGRPQICPNQHAMQVGLSLASLPLFPHDQHEQWYCLYLKMALNVSTTGDCLSFHLCTPNSCMSD